MSFWASLKDGLPFRRESFFNRYAFGFDSTQMITDAARLVNLSSEIRTDELNLNDGLCHQARFHPRTDMSGSKVLNRYSCS
jgi:hypothetical protein